MKTIGFRKSLLIEEEKSLELFDMPVPQPVGRDLLVKIEAVSVNPVDCKVRCSLDKTNTLEIPKILGYDACGIVESVGKKTNLFKVGDRVYYAGSILRDGSNAEYQLVDERIVGLKPNNLTSSQAAAIPLTAITAWEAIFDRLQISENRSYKGKKILIIGGAGGVGSIAIQLLKTLTNLTVIATASREQTKKWCKKMGADIVVNHKNLDKELENHNIKNVDYILNFVDTDSYWNLMCGLISPQGHICSIVRSSTDLDLSMLFQKSASFSWEFMFARSSFESDDIIEQHNLLTRVTELYEKNKLLSCLTEEFLGFNVENFKKAHKLLESKTTIGKIVVNFNGILK